MEKKANSEIQDAIERFSDGEYTPEAVTQVHKWLLIKKNSEQKKIDDFTLSLLTNSEVIDVNQDPLGIQAIPISKEEGKVIYAKHLENGPMAVGLFNTSDTEAEMEFSLREMGFRGAQTIRDLWRQQDLGSFDDVFRTRVPAHGVVLLKIYPGNSRERATEGR